MRPNLLKARMNSTPVALNGWSTSGSVGVVEAMASQPWDALTIDMQHGLSDFETTVHMLRAISAGTVTPMVRVPAMEPGIIMRVLDAGAYGIICPMINTAEQCKAFIDACRYAPLGNRSFGPTRAPLYAGVDYWTKANDTVLTFAMIETRQALENLEEITATEGLDGIYIGPADLSLSLGHHPIEDMDHPEVAGAIEKIRLAAIASGKYAVMHCTAIPLALKLMNGGWSMLTVGNDMRFLATGQQQMFDQLRSKSTSASAAAY